MKILKKTKIGIPEIGTFSAINSKVNTDFPYQFRLCVGRCMMCVGVWGEGVGWRWGVDVKASVIKLSVPQRSVSQKLL